MIKQPVEKGIIISITGMEKQSKKRQNSEPDFPVEGASMDGYMPSPLQQEMDLLQSWQPSEIQHSSTEILTQSISVKIEGGQDIKVRSQGRELTGGIGPFVYDPSQAANILLQAVRHVFVSFKWNRIPTAAALGVTEKTIEKAIVGGRFSKNELYLLAKGVSEALGEPFERFVQSDTDLERDSRQTTLVDPIDIVIHKLQTWSAEDIQAHNMEKTGLDFSENNPLLNPWVARDLAIDCYIWTECTSLDKTLLKISPIPKETHLACDPLYWVDRLSKIIHQRRTGHVDIGKLARRISDVIDSSK